jgi:hypothetical protein
MHFIFKVDFDAHDSLIGPNESQTQILMHRYPELTVQSSLMKSSTMENAVCLFQTVVF